MNYFHAHELPVHVADEQPLARTVMTHTHITAIAALMRP